MMEPVVLKKCARYDVHLLEEALVAAISDLNIDLSGEVSGKKVLIKPNLLGAHKPEKVVTTHPAVMEALIKLLQKYDCEIWIGDSPNGVQLSVEDVWIKTGMMELCDRYGIRKKYFEKEGAELIERILISKTVLDADYIINVPKFKTHSLTVITAAVKNMFGTVPGLKKTDYHRASVTRENFAHLLVKIAEASKPGLNILDAVESMAGNGPSGGFKVSTGFIAVSKDMHQLDLALAKFIGINPRHIDTLEEAEKLELINLDVDPSIIGDDPREIDLSGFTLPRTYTKNLREKWFFQFMVNRVMSLASVKPQVRKDRCIKCGMCVRICPVKVIKFQTDGFPHVNHSGCIECYCCHEACPKKAMRLKDSLGLKIFKWFGSRRK